MDCSKSLAIQRCYTSDPQSNTHMLQLGPLLLLFDPVRLALPGLMLLLASHMKLCRSQPILCLRLFLHTIQSICTKKLSVTGNDIVHSRAIYIIIVNGLCILGLKGGKATVVVWPLHIEPRTRNVKTEADGVLDPSLRQWVKRWIQRCLHMMIAPSMSEIGGRYATACYSAPGTRRTKASLDLPWLTLCTIWHRGRFLCLNLGSYASASTLDKRPVMDEGWFCWSLVHLIIVVLIPSLVDHGPGQRRSPNENQTAHSHGMLGSLTFNRFCGLMVEKKKTAMWDLRLLRCLVGCNDCLMATTKGRNFGVIHKPEGSHNAKVRHQERHQMTLYNRYKNTVSSKHKMLASTLSDLCTAASSASGDCYAHTHISPAQAFQHGRSSPRWSQLETAPLRSALFQQLASPW